MDNGLIVTLVIIAVVVIAIAVGVSVIISKVRSLSMNMFGTSSFIDGINKQKAEMSETPRSIHSMTNVYMPQILHDFPQFDAELYKNKAKSVLRNYLNAIENGSALSLAEECSLTLKNNVRGIVEELNSRNVKQCFDEVVIHDVQIARYIKDGASVKIGYELSVGCYSYIVDENGKVVFGEKDLKKQIIYEIDLIYVQDADKYGYNGDSLGINCPNCGAPIKNLGVKFCEYCGTSVVEVNVRAWKFDAVREQTTRKTAY